MNYVPRQLSRVDRRRQVSELKKSRRLYKQHTFYTRKRMPSFHSRESPHIRRAKRLFHVSTISPTNPALAAATGCSMAAMKAIVRKGEGAYYSSGSRPNQTPQSWGLARLASALTGHKAAVVDRDILEKCSDKFSSAYIMHKTRNKRKASTTRKGKNTRKMSNTSRRIRRGGEGVDESVKELLENEELPFKAFGPLLLDNTPEKQSFETKLKELLKTDLPFQKLTKLIKINKTQPPKMVLTDDGKFLNAIRIWKKLMKGPIDVTEYKLMENFYTKEAIEQSLSNIKKILTLDDKTKTYTVTDEPKPELSPNDIWTKFFKFQQITSTEYDKMIANFGETIVNNACEKKYILREGDTLRLTKFVLADIYSDFVEGNAIPESQYEILKKEYSSLDDVQNADYNNETRTYTKQKTPDEDPLDPNVRDREEILKFLHSNCGNGEIRIQGRCYDQERIDFLPALGPNNISQEQYGIVLQLPAPKSPEQIQKLDQKPETLAEQPEDEIWERNMRKELRKKKMRKRSKYGKDFSRINWQSTKNNSVYLPHIIRI
jgi:hypothetical protein